MHLRSGIWSFFQSFSKETAPNESFLHLSQDQASKDKALQNMAALSSAQIVSASVMKSQLPPLPQHPYPPPARVSSESKPHLVTLDSLT